MECFIENRDQGIKELRLEIKNSFCSQCNISKFNDIRNITVDNIKILIKLYDGYIFNKYLSTSLDNGIKVSLSSRMTSSGGKTIFTKSCGGAKYEIRISLSILKIFIDDNQPKFICGIECNDVIDGLMLILEHELCHVLEFSIYGNSNCNMIRFKNMSHKLFSHKSSKHEVLKSSLKTNNETHFIKGQVVNLIYKGEKLEGIISNVNKRATVMIKDVVGNYKDSNGISYSKWYIPLSMLIKKE